MTEAERLRLAGEYRRAYTETDLIARVGFNTLADLRRQGVDPSLIVPALYAHMDQFHAAVEVERAAFAAMEAARNNA
jgi:hypothetical protein